MAVDGAARTRRLPWHESRDGLALCGSARAAGTAALSGLERPAAHRCRTCAFCGIGCCPRRTDPRQHPVPGTALDCSGSTHRLRRLSPCSRATPSMGGDACGLSRSHVMVVLDGLCARSRTDARARFSCDNASRIFTTPTRRMALIPRMGRILISSTIPGLPQSRSLFTPWGTCWSRVLLQWSSMKNWGCASCSARGSIST